MVSAVAAAPSPLPAPAAPAAARIRESLRLVRKAVAIGGMLGPAGVVVRTVQRLVPRRVVFVDWYDVMETRSAAVNVPIARAMPGARWMTAADAAAAGELVRGGQEMRARLGRGDRGALLERGGRVVAHLFFTQRTYDESGLVFATGGDTWWVYDGWVAADARGQGLHPRLFAAAIGDLGDGGVRALSTIDVLNTSSRRAAARRGARAIGRVLNVRVAGVALSGVRWTGRPTAWRLHTGPREVVVAGVPRT